MAKICTDDESKEIIGQSAEDEFDECWECYYCRLSLIKQPPPLPDRKCPNCGLEVDIKGAPEAKEYGKITISQIPFDNWHSGVIIAWRPKIHEWYGTRKYFCLDNIEGPFEPEHDGKRPTSYYKIDISVFDTLYKFLWHK